MFFVGNIWWMKSNTVVSECRGMFTVTKQSPSASDPTGNENPNHVTTQTLTQSVQSPLVSDARFWPYRARRSRNMQPRESSLPRHLTCAELKSLWKSSHFLSSILFWWFYYSRIKKGEGQGKNVTLETMMHSKSVKRTSVYIMCRLDKWSTQEGMYSVTVTNPVKTHPNKKETINAITMYTNQILSTKSIP